MGTASDEFSPSTGLVPFVSQGVEEGLCIVDSNGALTTPVVHVQWEDNHPAGPDTHVTLSFEDGTNVCLPFGVELFGVLPGQALSIGLHDRERARPATWGAAGWWGQPLELTRVTASGSAAQMFTTRCVIAGEGYSSVVVFPHGIAEAELPAVSVRLADACRLIDQQLARLNAESRAQLPTESSTEMFDSCDLISVQFEVPKPAEPPTVRLSWGTDGTYAVTTIQGPDIVRVELAD